MINTIFNLIGMNFDSYNLSEDVVFCAAAIILLYCLGFMFNFFQTLMERCTARGR